MSIRVNLWSDNRSANHGFAQIIADTDMLIGMDVISLCDFAITNSGKDTKFSFQIPSVFDIDFEKL